tara:strand:+ start:1408 stop:1563 length:156 start_codon:yes stop_codon:yes gene_type:complete
MMATANSFLRVGCLVGLLGMDPASGLSAAPAGDASPKRWNVVLVITDDQGK